MMAGQTYGNTAEYGACMYKGEACITDTNTSITMVAPNRLLLEQFIRPIRAGETGGDQWQTE